MNKEDKAPALMDLIFVSKKVKMLVSQLCLTLCDSMDSRPPDSLSLELSRQEC